MIPKAMAAKRIAGSSRSVSVTLDILIIALAIHAGVRMVTPGTAALLARQERVAGLERRRAMVTAVRPVGRSPGAFTTNALALRIRGIKQVQHAAKDTTCADARSRVYTVIDSPLTKVALMQAWMRRERTATRSLPHLSFELLYRGCYNSF